MDRLDVKLWALAEKGQIVPDRSLLKTPEQIAEIRKSADLNTAVLDHVAAHIKAGMSTAQIDKLVYDFTTEHGGIPAPLGYEGFPKSVCTSINNVVCHGIPSENEYAINTHAKKNGYSVVEEIGGHGIGLEFHEEPFVSYVTPKGSEMVLVPGMMFTIEPMINEGTPEFYVDEDNGWTVYTDDDGLSAQVEYMVLVKEKSVEVLTK